MYILIVQDNPIIALDLREMISGMDIARVVVAKNKREVEKLTSKESPTITLLDATNKNEESGIEMAKNIKAIRQSKIIYLIGNRTRELIEYARTTNPIALLSKPFEEADLVDKIRGAMRG